MEEQKFKEYQKTRKKTLRIFTVENAIVFFLAFLVVGLWWFFVKKYVKANVQESEIFKTEKLLKVVFFDVGQGDSALISTPEGKNILIDAGSIKGATIEEGEEGELITEVDAAESVILPYFNKNNLTKLDAIIITHPHIDHFGGAIKIIDSLQVDLFVNNGQTSANPYLEELLNKVGAKKIKYINPSPGDILPVKEDDFELKFLTLRSLFTAKDPSPTNNSSLVAKLRYKNFTVLFTGDIETEAELELLGWKKELKSTILKVPHHGSRTSTSLPFLDAVAPTVAVISCGRGNPYGHPHDEVVERLNRKKIKVYRTDAASSITFLTDGIKYIKR